MLLGLSATLLAGGVARFLQPLPGPGQPPPECQRLLPDTKVRHLPSTGWRAIPVVLLTEKMSQLSREPNPWLDILIKQNRFLCWTHSDCSHLPPVLETNSLDPWIKFDLVLSSPKLPGSRLLWYQRQSFLLCMHLVVLFSFLKILIFLLAGSFKSSAQ